MEYEFTVDENGNMVYTENEVIEDDSLFDPGAPVLDPESGMAVMSQEAPETVTGSDDFSDSEPAVMVLSEELTRAIVSIAPAPGSLNSSVLDYFDRVVDGLDYDYGYVAVKTGVDNYSATLFYGEDFDYNGSEVLFGAESVRIDVTRYSSGTTNYIQYDHSDASDSVVPVSVDGNYLYYSNIAPGFARLGTYDKSPGYGILMGILIFVLIVYIAVRRLLFND